MNGVYLVLTLCMLQIRVGICLSFEEEIKQNYQHFREKCIAETGAQGDLIDKMNEGIFTEEQSIKCYTKCLVTSFGKFNDDGSINIDSLIAILPEHHREDYIALFRACENIVGTDNCDTAFLLNKCLYNTNPDLHFML